jgi:3-mercaptopyruvate sulfurtransferase SseA
VKPAARRRGRLATAFALTLAMLAGIPSCSGTASTIPSDHLIGIDELATMLADSTAPVRPVLLHVGFAALYRAGHIPGSRYMGAGSKREGLDGLKQALADVPADQPVILYCGCCPWGDCPNVRPAYRVAQVAHPSVRVLRIDRNFERDWVAKGLPSVGGTE